MLGANFGPLLSRVFEFVTRVLDRRVGWDKLPLPLGLLTLIGIRSRLRRRNLHDTWSIPKRDLREPPDGRHLTARTADGSFNDLENPAMGSSEMPFGRNVPLESTYPENDWSVCNDPNPRVVSQRLLARDAFKPATSLNLLAAGWIQFMVRDWFSHGKASIEDAWELEIEDGDPWPGRSMSIPRTPQAARSPGPTSPPTFINTETHWWDGSQIYGSNRETLARVRDGQPHGKVNPGRAGFIPVDPNPDRNPAGEPGFWVGFALMHKLFRLEHNAICDRLRAEYPTWSDDDVFDRARLINAALMAKIHTVEWTPAILGHPTLRVAMRANWWGLASERLYKLFGRISSSEVVSGIPGGSKDHFGVPYAITEEFVAVYRMHPLIPDHFELYSSTTGDHLEGRSFPGIVGEKAMNLMAATDGPEAEPSLADLFYSFGIAHPGALTLHNYPGSLRRFERPKGGGQPPVFQDLAATDVLRMREFGVPRYNELRRLLHLPPARSFEDLTDNPVWVREMREVYGDVERVDLMVGILAEDRPEGFGFGETAFRIFVLMASRRLNSDRFFTTDYTPEVYTPVGMHWISSNDMSTVVLRHLPELQGSLSPGDNAFAPWRRVRPRTQPGRQGA